MFHGSNTCNNSRLNQTISHGWHKACSRAHQKLCAYIRLFVVVCFGYYVLVCFFCFFVVFSALLCYTRVRFIGSPFGVHSVVLIQRDQSQSVWYCCNFFLKFIPVIFISFAFKKFTDAFSAWFFFLFFRKKKLSLFVFHGAPSKIIEKYVYISVDLIVERFFFLRKTSVNNLSDFVLCECGKKYLRIKSESKKKKNYNICHCNS